MRFKTSLFLFLLIAFAFTNEIYARQFIKSDHVRVELVTPQAQVGRDGILKAAVYFQLDPEWHVYWQNPGDSGAAPKFRATGATLEKIHWPYPQRLPVSDLTNFGYKHEVAILLDLRLDPNLLKSAGGQTKVIFNLEWLVCKVECIPGFVEMFLPVKIGDNEILKDSHDREMALYDKFKLRLPRTADSKITREQWLVENVSRQTENFNFELISKKLKTASEIYIFPQDGSTFTTHMPVMNIEGDRLKVSMPLSVNAVPTDTTENFTVVAKYPEVKNQDRPAHAANGHIEAFDLSLTPKSSMTHLFWGLLLALMGGVILNLMPCVFPILSLKIFSFLKESETTAVRRAGWAYTVGVLMTFAGAGALLTFLRFSGEAVGWGYQLQNPWLVYALATLFFFMALNFLGLFEFGNSIANTAGQLGTHKFLSGSFGTGVLAVIVASPCTAPFMGSALGLTLLLPWYESLLIFISLGLGMALPMLVFAYSPRLIALLPRAGSWMENVKQFMAFPMLATALWLLWVLGQQKSTEAVLVALGSFLILSLGLWLLQKSSSRWAQVFAWLFIVLPTVSGVRYVHKAPAAGVGGANGVSSTAWQPFDAATLENKISTQSVFIDFTAAWCITCQVNKKSVLDTDDIQKIFKENGVLLIRADWTNHDAQITKALAQFGRNSVPVYVFYAAPANGRAAPAQILPQILTKDMIFDLFKK